MANLSEILGKRVDIADGDIGDTGLEQGQIFVFTPATNATDLYEDGQICWQAPRTGKVVLEIWGAGGSTGRQCCCGGGSLPGNAGAYSKKTFCVQTGSYICGTVGMSCGNASARDYRGCSESTCICWVGRDLNGCMCAEGGMGGCSRCSTSTAPYCCLVQRGYEHVSYGSNCGLICNWVYDATTVTPSCRGFAYGGDINKFGGVSCTSIMHTNPNCYCCAQYHVAVPPGIFSEDGATITFQGEQSVAHGDHSGNQTFAFMHGLAVAGKNPVRGGLYVNGCWSGANRLCGCYEDMGCLPFIPYGIGGMPAQVRHSIRDHPSRGGHGAVRIKFIGTN